MNLTKSVLKFDENEVALLCSSEKCYLSFLKTKEITETENYLNYEKILV